jgi:hypothetical protein
MRAALCKIFYAYVTLAKLLVVSSPSRPRNSHLDRKKKDKKNKKKITRSF